MQQQKCNQHAGNQWKKEAQSYILRPKRTNAVSVGLDIRPVMTLSNTWG